MRLTICALCLPFVMRIAESGDSRYVSIMDLDTTSIPELTAEELQQLYKLLISTRELDLAAVAWQRQGILPGYAPELGQEAAQVGSAFALDTSRDFAFPTYREMGVA